MSIHLLLSGFNPLKIGSVCNVLTDHPQWLKVVSIPLKSGRFVMYEVWVIENEPIVSIPLKSGRFVMVVICGIGIKKVCFNPLKIGSVCNTNE